VINPSGLPFGMAMDNYRNLWFAQHVIDKVGILDPRSGGATEIRIPSSGSFVQYLVSDSNGTIWAAEQRGSGLGRISSLGTGAVPPTPNSATDGSDSGSVATSSSSSSSSSYPLFGLEFIDILSPSVASAIVLSAALYAKSQLDLRKSLRIAQQNTR
jgi:copper transport protein